MKRGKKITIIVGSILLVLLLVAGIGAFAMFRNELRVIGTIEKLNEDRLYTMEFSGDYGLDALLEAGGVSSSSELAVFISQRISKGFYTYELEESTHGCSTLSAVNSAGDKVFGRNFDWEDSTTMVVTTKPDNGYQSISTVNLDFLGYDRDYQPDGLFNSFLALAAPLVPMDGMNEKGLCVADLVVRGLPETQQSTGKIGVTTTLAIRILLDHAATVDEAIALLEQYDMHSDIGIMHHLSISDVTGRSVVVEYLDNQMYVTETNIVTNFILTEGEYYGTGTEESKERFDILVQYYDKNKGILEEEEVKEALIAVSQTAGGFEPQWSTPWSIVYNQSTLELELYHYENYELAYTFAF